MESSGGLHLSNRSLQFFNLVVFLTEEDTKRDVGKLSPDDLCQHLNQTVLLIEQCLPLSCPG